MGERVRTFVAVEAPPEVQSRAGELISRLSAVDAKVKWVEPRNLHWTLKFLGNVDMVEIPDVCSAVEEAVKSIAPFDLEARGAGAFPNLRNPRTIWLGVGEGANEMVGLHRAVESSLAKLGFREEGRRFRPHITIGRVREGGAPPRELARLLEENAEFEGRPTTVFNVTVFSSFLGREGPSYEVLAHLDLEG
jgi:RNA 2',3'-cyclic 3'-phosphodiesterase